MNEVAKVNSEAGLNLINAEKLNVLINQAPPQENVKLNKAANNSKYLPISFVEMKLDELFFGLWQLRNFQYSVIANEIVGVIELGVFHPVLNDWIWRTGTAAAMIQQRKGSDITDISAKHKNTLVKDFPHLKAECMKNAARSLGKAFGRDLNRDFTDTYTPASTEMEAMETKHQRIIDEIKAAAKDQLGEMFKKYKNVPGALAAIKDRRKELENAQNAAA